MSSGRQQGEEKARELRDWIEGLTNYDDNGNPNYDQFREYAYRGTKLNRQEIKRELNFGDSTLKTNAGAVKLLKEIEDRLRNVGILKLEGEEKSEPPLRDRNEAQNRRDKQRLNQLEQQNAALRAENSALKAKLK